ADVLGRGQATQRGPLDHVVDLVLVEHIVRADGPEARFTDRLRTLGDHQARADDVRPDPVAAVFACNGAGQGYHRSLRRTVDALRICPKAASLAMNAIAPPPAAFIGPIAAWVAATAVKRLISMVRCHLSRSVSVAMNPGTLHPALFTRTSMPPQF